MGTRKTWMLALSLLLLLDPLRGQAQGEDAAVAIGALLDRFHQAAADADEEAYFATMTGDAIFLGTDGSERWQGQAFRDFVHPHFDSGKGWDYQPLSRNIIIAPGGASAWFDEALHNESLGACRGSGVLVLEDSGWKVAQYNLSVPIPNSLVDAVVADIAALASGVVPGSGSAAEGEVDSNADTEKAAAEQHAGCNRKGFKNNRKAGC